MMLRRTAWLLAAPCMLFTAQACAEGYNNYGAQRRGAPRTRITQPTQQAVDAALRGRANLQEDAEREAILRGRDEFSDRHGYDYGRRDEAGDRFRYGAERHGDEYGRANARDRFPVDSAYGIDRSGNNLRPPLGGAASGSYSSSSSSTSTTTINQSGRIDASGNAVP